MRIYDSYYGWGTVHFVEDGYSLVFFDSDPEYPHAVKIDVEEDEEEEI